jgi:hypothetical protein
VKPLTELEASKPSDTVRLLTKLREFGLTDRHFAELHHFHDETINSHSAYCNKVSSFSSRDKLSRSTASQVYRRTI